MLILCPQCKGAKRVREINWFFAIFTLGMTAMLDRNDPVTCPTCDGKGTIQC